MHQSENPLPLASLLGEAKELGPTLGWSLLRHLSEWMLDLSHSVDTEAMEPVQASAPVDTACPPAVEGEAPQPAGVLALPEYGDEAALHEIRMEALHVFETRTFRHESMVALWLDVVPFWGHSLMVCMGVNREGYRRVLGFVEASLQELDVLRHLIEDMVDRGLCVEAGLLWIVPGPGEVSHLLAKWFGPQIRIQHCQVQKCRRVSSALAEPDQGEVYRALKRAFEIPEPKQAKAALMQIHADLLNRNRSAAQRLLKDLDLTLTVHQSGMLQQLSPGLRTTRCIARTAQYLNQRTRGIRHWLPPKTRRAQIALLLLETELHTRRLAYASVLPSMQEALFSNEEENDVS